jgi:hypothetical protein
MIHPTHTVRRKQGLSLGQPRRHVCSQDHPGQQKPKNNHRLPGNEDEHCRTSGTNFPEEYANNRPGIGHAKYSRCSVVELLRHHAVVYALSFAQGHSSPIIARVQSSSYCSCFDTACLKSEARVANAEWVTALLPKQKCCAALTRYPLGCIVRDSSRVSGNASTYPIANAT